jgi:hypothetical protein
MIIKNLQRHWTAFVSSFVPKKTVGVVVVWSKIRYNVPLKVILSYKNSVTKIDDQFLF